ncbi:hypothetical protein N4T77_02350 [Clostridium sp. CX1]|uniref:Collagen-like protein n=1 Tax=Clostridium tanneri TaxID=3037988 RepID=A0ABU4JT46_9CLOT|nr:MULTISPECIES: hypothetical protein [unclassified Clostridium]MCT8975430.1 hypothetical protein [Clostridium sp. CX1]MDW8801339.1 hypothetical protein [Clostridium sp. A1-XYC3]
MYFRNEDFYYDYEDVEELRDYEEVCPFYEMCQQYEEDLLMRQEFNQPPRPGFPNFPPPPGQGAPNLPPPPGRVPQKPSAGFGGPGGPQTFAVSPGSIRRCRNRFVYIWLRNGNSFWAYLTRIDRTTASGYRWNGRRWVYFGVDLRRIDEFVCR